MLEQENTVETKKLGLGARLVLIVMALLSVVIIALCLMRVIGKHNLKTAVVGDGDQIIGDQSKDLSDNQISYNGKVYQLNEDLVTILVMGIDSETVEEVGGQSWDASGSEELSGGQADSLFLMVINPHTEKISLLTINRNTMADVDVWDADGNYLGQFVKQIALQHGYGKGDEESCLRQVKAVSRLLYDIPINSYAAISMDGIPKLTDSVGGITVDVLDDIVYPEYDMNLHQGERVKLEGKTAYWYVRLRDENQFNSNELRLNRQKQFLKIFIDTAKAKCESDIRVALELYSIISDYMVTDIDVNQFTYMATEYKNYKVDTNNILTLKGETLQGEKFEEFYIDQEATKQLVVDLFYEPVK